MHTRKYTNRRYLDALAERVLVYDGAMGTNIQALNLSAADFGGEAYNGCNDYLVISNPQAVEKVHRAFMEAGVDVLETDTFRANRITLAEYGLQERTLEINQRAAELARRLADEYSARSAQTRFVAGSMGPSGKLPSADDPDLSNVDYDDLAEVFREQATGLIRGGVDLLIVETSQDILEVKAAIHGITQAFAETGVYLPIQAQVTLDTNGRMLLGTDIAAALAILEGLPIDVIGMNCSTGPEHMRETARFLGENATLPVSTIPNAGLPINVDGEAVYPLQPEPFAEAMVEFVEKYKVSVVGGCCGTSPAHLKCLVDRLHQRGAKPSLRPQQGTPRLASAVQAMAMHQEPPPLLIGERCNAQGSREFKRLLLAEDYDAILALARRQVDSGAHALDISVAVTEHANEEETMRSVIRKLVVAGIGVPFVIDTTEPSVMEAALKTAPGRCMLNSTHLEGGREKAERVFRMAKEHNAAVLVLTIDEEGMAKTVQRKVEVARRLFAIAVNEFGLRPQDLVYDALTFTLATGDAELLDSAIATIEGIRRIKSELPGVFTSLGVSNVSFGLAKNARPALNSVFLYHCVQAGLDMAIVNPAQVLPYAEIPQEQRELLEDLIFNRRPDALQRVIEFYAAQTGEQSGAQETSASPLDGLPADQRLHQRVLLRHKDGVEVDIDELIARNGFPTRHDCAVHILNQVLLPAMKEVGDKFGSGELILPFVLQSAEVMKKAVTHLEQYLDKAAGVSKGTVVLATVYGDVHDIGKNLVKTILSNNGYTVLDLGKQVPAETIISKAIENKADAIGLSALLVSTSKQMPLVVNELQRRNLSIPVLVGGAAINRRFGYRIFFAENGAAYSPGVFYCKDAFEGLDKMDKLMNPQVRPQLLETLQREAAHELEREAQTSARPPAQKQRSQTPPAPAIPKPPFWGARRAADLPLDEVFACLSKNELFRLSWGAKNAQGEAWQKLNAEFEARLANMQHAAARHVWLSPQAVYGYFPVQADGDDLVIFDPATVNASAPQELTRFTFPRQPSAEALCLADYFLPLGAEQVDVAVFQVVTVGQTASSRFDELQDAGDYSEAYFFHGLAVQTAEATAEYLHRRVRRELGIAERQGKRYSWGFPAIPELDDHLRVFELLPAERELGMSLTPACQLVPEQSTAAIIVHHPNAHYFGVGETRLEQLRREK